LSPHCEIGAGGEAWTGTGSQTGIVFCSRKGLPQNSDYFMPMRQKIGSRLEELALPTPHA